MDKDAVKTQIAAIKLERKRLSALNNQSCKEYRARAAENRKLGEQIHELEASIRTERSAKKLESLTVEQVEAILADLKAKNASTDDNIA